MNRFTHQHTIYASYLGYITQAIVNNLAPLFFLTFAHEFDLSLSQITFITTINFAVQLVVDALSTIYVDKIGCRKCIVAAHVFSAAGLIGMATLPSLITNRYVGLLMAVVLYAIGGGIIEVLISPIVEACPTEKKEAVMSLLHAFYCWGHVGVVLLSTLFFSTIGVENWRILSVLFALVPLFNIFFFMKVPMYDIVPEGKKMPLVTLLQEKMFWLLMIIMVCAGASEQAMSQWSSAFAESALSVSKIVGDLAGPCAFALLMGMARAFYGKYSEQLPLERMMVMSAMLCIGCYLLAVFAKNPLLGLLGCSLCGFSVGIFWPGTFSIAAQRLPSGGTAMYALMALGGDIGCSAGPTLVGMVASMQGGDLKAGLILAIIFPILIALGIFKLRHRKRT